jgi:transposase
VEKELEQFREEVRRLRAGRRSGSLPFPEALRAFAVRYVEQALEAGDTKTAAVAKLGVSEPTLNAWKKGLPASRPRSRPSKTPAPSRSRPPTPNRRPLRAGGPGHQFAGKRYGEPVSNGSGGALQLLPKLGGCP